MATAPPRLPPWPDELLEPSRKEDAIRYLLSLDMPERYRASWLQRWAEFTKADVTAADYARVRRLAPALGGP